MCLAPPPSPHMPTISWFLPNEPPAGAEAPCTQEWGSKHTAHVPNVLTLQRTCRQGGRLGKYAGRQGGQAGGGGEGGARARQEEG